MNTHMTRYELAAFEYAAQNEKSAAAAHEAGYRVDLNPAKVNGLVCCGPTTGAWMTANGVEHVVTVQVGGHVGFVQVEHVPTLAEQLEAEDEAAAELARDERGYRSRGAI